MPSRRFDSDAFDHPRSDGNVLKAPGVKWCLVFQATNRYIDLMPVVKRLASEFGMQAVLVSDVPTLKTGPEYWLSPTDQILVRATTGAASR